MMKSSVCERPASVGPADYDSEATHRRALPFVCAAVAGALRNL